MKRDPISERLTGGVKATAGLSWAIAREAGASILTYELYPPGIMAEQVGEAVDSLRRRCNVPQVDVIAHSLGGIIARYYVQLQGGDGPVRNLITLGTPHGGTELSRLSILPNVRDLNPESPIIRRLNAGPPPRHTQGLAISGALDIVVRPRSHAWWKGVRNVELKRVGHAGLLFSGRVAKLIESRLN
ncbi:MAG: alpha/beta fold hydrolase [Deltaproteobacteria bacterium]|nr:alpha/beta fold hydrolase [Deltaproteobacteria bacterium]